MIKDKKPNPFNVFNIRQVKSPVPYFEYVDLPLKYNLETSLSKWIQSNVKNRYYVGRKVTLDKDNKLSQIITVGFEENRDMSYFMLACPHLKYS
ncbi:MAG: hypothetical protein CMG35_04685 [Candidatus Marinimicrobia bacterium]|jgi:hypothetical protein|nr:hypothetical protein [Candidatus Neomarinimicrobiota bacterium]|tara:strand:- start:106 stop:387 length:282 start_codon:yes stop_codon:yes gene_type:complete